MQKLSSLLSNKSLDERNNEINICLDSIVYRVGANGKERKSVLNKLYKDIINFSLPALHRYFVWAADRGAHLFNEGIEKEEDHWYRELAQVPKDEQLERLGKIKGIFVRQKDSLTSSSKRLLEAKTIMENSGPGFDRIVNQMREIMSPSQIAELLLFVDQHQYKKEIRLFDVDYEEGEGPNTWEDN